MPRVAFFIDTPHRFTGSHRSLLAAVERIEAHGIVPCVVVPADGLAAESFRRAGVRVVVLPANATLLTFDKQLLRIGTLDKLRVFFADVLPYSVRFAALVRTERVDVVHFNTARGILLAGLGAKLASLPTVLHVRGVVAFDGVYWHAAQAFADRIVLVANALMDCVAQRFRSVTRVVYNGVVAPPATAKLGPARERVFKDLAIATPDGSRPL